MKLSIVTLVSAHDSYDSPSGLENILFLAGLTLVGLGIYAGIKAIDRYFK